MGGKISINTNDIIGASYCVFIPNSNFYFLYVFKKEYFLLMEVHNDYIIDIYSLLFMRVRVHGIIPPQV